MSITQNVQLASEIRDFLIKKLPIKLGVNKLGELTRLIYEISKAKELTLEETIKLIDLDGKIEEGKSGLFHRIKARLVELRYPLLDPDEVLHLVPYHLDDIPYQCKSWDFKISPRRIFVEKSVQDANWTKSFIKNFSGSDIILIDKLSEGFDSLEEEDPVKLYNKRGENLFIVKNKASFVKKCPCSKDVRRCGYWILNIGFGCPMDCSYCYLQMYSNAPGLIFTANVEDYFPYVEDLNKKVTKRTRIGTGEFTDSLYLDKYTGYSKLLLSFFREMDNLVLELKTKAVDVENILKEKPHDNLVVSWSLNTRAMARKYEMGASTIDQRIEAVTKLAESGFKVGFHFDPLVYYKDWEKEYKELVKEIFSHKTLSGKVAWISLGTLRYTPGLKQIAERRYEDNNLYYWGDFSVDADGKLRYPKDVRVDMYNKMIEWIRQFDDSCWIYLCMEPEQVWRKTILGKQDYDRCNGFG